MIGDYLERRRFIPLVGLGLTSGAVGFYGRTDPPPPEPPGYSPVAVLTAEDYSVDLVDRIVRGAKACDLDVKGKRVLLKPNIVEFDPGTAINTDPSVVLAGIEAFQRMGAAEVLIGEGPGHRRDTLDLADQAGYRNAIPHFDGRFVDLNRDDVTRLDGYTVNGHVFVSNTALATDLVVSMPKMKTHHWAGATLSMKNLFGTVPGEIYGWPKNMLHYNGIDRSIVELARIFRKTFAIVDGVVGMEGNGPIQGRPVRAGVLVMGTDLVAVDATCCRIMGINPKRINYIVQASTFGHLNSDQIEQRGEAISKLQRQFVLPSNFAGLRQPA